MLVTSTDGVSGVSTVKDAPPSPPNTLERDVQTLEKAIYEVKRVIVGQDRLVERLLVGVLAKGHVLLEGVPGIAKTLAVETFAKVVGGSFSRVQFTPDLVPTDLVGTRIYRQGREEFDTELGPV
ncbi:AAA family ATPase, partial [Nocardia sp. NPDC059246]